MHLSPRRAFTLVELMIVVAIVGVLAVLAVYGVRKYIANAKTAEAKNSLGQMAKDAVTAYESERMSSAVALGGTSVGINRQFCPDSSVSVPAAAPRGKKYQSSRLDWSNATDVLSNKGFPCLRFEMTAPQYYSYSYGGVTTGAAGVFTALARGDLNGDGIASSFWLNGAVLNTRAVIAPAIGEVSPEE